MRDTWLEKRPKIRKDQFDSVGGVEGKSAGATWMFQERQAGGPI